MKKNSDDGGPQNGHENIESCLLGSIEGGSKTMDLYNKLTSVVRDPKYEVNDKTSVFVDTIYVPWTY